MKVSVLLHIIFFHRKFIKKLFNSHIILEAFCHKFQQIQVVVYSEHYFAGVPARPFYLRSVAHH